jgi:hypothetical protein
MIFIISEIYCQCFESTRAHVVATICRKGDTGSKENGDASAESEAPPVVQ